MEKSKSGIEFDPEENMTQLQDFSKVHWFQNNFS